MRDVLGPRGHHDRQATGSCASRQRARFARASARRARPREQGHSLVCPAAARLRGLFRLCGQQSHRLRGFAARISWLTDVGDGRQRAGARVLSGTRGGGREIPRGGRRRRRAAAGGRRGRVEERNTFLRANTVGGRGVEFSTVKSPRARVTTCKELIYQS